MKPRKIPTVDKSLPIVLVKERQQFDINGNIMYWYYANPELKQGIILSHFAQEVTPVAITTVPE